MPVQVKDGDDITSLINGVKEGDDITSLINGSKVDVRPDVKPKSLLTGSPFDPEDKSSVLDKAKTVGKRLLFGDEKTPEGRQIAGPPRSDDSLLPANITGKKEPESYLGGFTNSLYKDFVRPLASPSSALSILGTRGATGAMDEASRLGAADKGLPIDPRAIPLRDGPMYGPKNAPLGLPSAPPEITNPPRFISGDKGVAEANKTYPMDIAPQSPRLGQQDAGTILPRETEGITELPGSEAARLGTRFGDIPKIETSSPKANIVSLDKTRNGSPIQLPQIAAEPNGGINLPEIESPYQSKSAIRESKSKPQALDATGEIPGNTNPRANGSSTAVAKNSSNTGPSSGIPSAGQAVAETPLVQPHSITNKPSKDVNFIRREVGSVDRTLNSRPETQGVVQPIIEAQDKKSQWIATTQRQLADLTAGLSKSDRIEFGELLDRGTTIQDNPMLVQRVEAARKILDSAHTMVPGLKGDSQIGYIENYLTHIAKAGDDTGLGTRQIWESYFKKPFKDIFTTAELNSNPKTAPGIGDMYDKGLGNPNSPFARERTGKLKDIELDVNKVFPAYTESIAKQIFDKPAVDAAKKVIAGLADTDIYGQPSKLKALAEWYVKNYTHYDAQAALGDVWNKYTNDIMQTTARSMLGFSTGLQTLHLARIPMNLYPELGEKYLMHGAGQIMKNPVAAYNEAARLGLLQNAIKPFSFRTTGEKLDSITGFFQAADFLDKSIGYHGFKQKFIDSGLSAEDASLKAIAASKKASLTVDPARSIKSFNPEPGLVGSLAKLTTQFKQVPVKIIEQYLSIASNAKKDPKTAARALIGLSLTAAAAEAGFHTLHVSPKQFAMDTGGASWSVMKGIGRELYKGNVVKALEDTALWLTPGGKSIQRQMNNGLSMFEKEKDKKYDLPMPPR